MEALIAYDVSTTSAEGRRRLRQVARACEGFGQRVQLSLFEVVCSESALAKLLAKLETIMDAQCDRLRVYRLVQGTLGRVETLGQTEGFASEQAWVL